mgnify:CR=1 FL=1
MLRQLPRHNRVLLGNWLLTKPACTLELVQNLLGKVKLLFEDLYGSLCSHRGFLLLLDRWCDVSLRDGFFIGRNIEPVIKLTLFRIHFNRGRRRITLRDGPLCALSSPVGRVFAAQEPVTASARIAFLLELFELRAELLLVHLFDTPPLLLLHLGLNFLIAAASATIADIILLMLRRRRSIDTLSKLHLLLG